MSKMQEILFILVGLYFGMMLLLYFTQRSIIYHPDTNKPVPEDYDAADMTVFTARAGLEGWYTAPQDPDKPVVVMFHGNAGHIGVRVFKIRSLIEAGYGVLLAEYRGFGGNTGQPTERGLYEDARFYVEGMMKAFNVAESQMVFYGESLGTGVAVQMASEYPEAHALILEAAYTSFPALAQKRYPFWPAYFLVKDRYESDKKIKDITMPLLILHGEKDNIVPFSMGQKLLQSANEPKEMAVFPQGRHNDLYAHGAAKKILAFLEEIEG